MTNTEATNLLKLRLMNGPLANCKKTINMDESDTLPGDIITIEGRKGEFHSYWIKPETLIDGSFKTWYINDSNGVVT